MIKDYLGVACAFACGALLLGACGANSDGAQSSGPITTGGAGGAAGGAAPIMAGAGGAASAGAASAGAPAGGASGGSAGGSGAAAGGGAGSGGAGGASGAAGTGGTGGGDTVDPGSDGDVVRTVNMPFNAAPEVGKVDGVPHGKVIKFTIAAGSSQRYPKAVAREVNVYVPAQYVTGTPAPVMVVQDGNNFFGFVSSLSNTLDNLINAKKLPPIVAVYANNGGGDAQGSERGLEYDTLSGVYAEWVDQELLPRVEQETTKQLAAQAVTFTKDPEGRAALGGSSGGIASFIMTWYHPDLFRRALTFSPSFVAQESPVNPAHPLGAWNFHSDNDERKGPDDGGIIAKTTPNKPIRVWLECGTNDNTGGTQYPNYDFEIAIRRVQAKMALKAYHVHLDVGTGATHVDGGMIKATLPDAMLWVWRGYQGAL